MKIYAAHGINDFVICLGYKGYVIKEYFANYYLHGADVTFDLREGSMEVIQNQTEPGYFVMSPDVGKYLGDDKTVFEKEPLMNLADNGELMAYQHKGFWQPMDTIRERQELEKHWATGNAPWKIWKD